MKQTFYQVLIESLQITIDATTQGSFMSKTPADAYALLEKMATNNYQWHGERNQPRKAAGAYEIDSLGMVNAKLDTLTKKLERLNFAGHPSQVLYSEICGVGHAIVEC